jgi:hypothetical protein
MTTLIALVLVAAAAGLLVALGAPVVAYPVVLPVALVAGISLIRKER